MIWRGRGVTRRKRCFFAYEAYGMRRDSFKIRLRWKIRKAEMPRPLLRRHCRMPQLAGGELPRYLSQNNRPGLRKHQNMMSEFGAGEKRTRRRFVCCIGLSREPGMRHSALSAVARRPRNAQHLGCFGLAPGQTSANRLAWARWLLCTV